MYADLIEMEGIDSQVFAILSPKRRATGFSLFSGSTYSADFDYGYVSEVTINGSSLTMASSLPLSAGQFYYDTLNEVLYVRDSDSGDVTTRFIVATYELYYGTKDEHWYRDPLDDSSDDIYYEAKVDSSPKLKFDVSDSLFGFQPVQRSNIKIINTDHSLERHIFDSSFSRARIRIYNVLKQNPQDEVEVDNIKLVYDGFCASHGYDGGVVSIETVSGEDEFSKEYRNEDESFYSLATFASLDPNFVGKPIRYVYGVVDGFIPVNIDYTAYDVATTSDNRIWSVIGEQVNLSNLSKTVGGGVHTATRTYLTSVTGLRVDDSVFMNRASGTDEYKIITVVGANYIEHSALSGGAMADGDTVQRSFVGNITVIQNNVVYKPLFNRDYTTSGALSGGCAGFTFTNNFEAALSMPGPLTPNDKVFCRVYGRTNDVTLGGPSFGSNDSESGNLANPIVVVLDLMKRILGISEARINAASFTAALALRTDAIGLAIPQSASSSFPKMKDILLDIIETSLIRVYIDDDLLWAVQAIEPLGSSDFTIDDSEILKESLSYDFDLKDVVSDIIVKYNSQETGIIENSEDISNQVTSSSITAMYLHGINKQRTVNSLHFKESDAQVLADRYIYIFGDRAGEVSFKCKNRFFEVQIGDVMTVQRTKIPGFEYDEETEHTKDFVVTTVDKSKTDVTLKLNDQKGIEDNEASW